MAVVSPTMAGVQHAEDTQFAGLVQVATAAADEQTRTAFALGKRKRDDSLSEHVAATSDRMTIDDDPDLSAAPSTPQLQSPASLLFREPSSKSRKHSRPPLGKVFSSLELAPENFLKLQTAAKAFMLDEAHPERRDVVGNKNTVTGSDLAKLNLWKCVEEFLSAHGYGEKYFAPGAGDGIPGAPPRSLFWPRDSQNIIRLMMPLMRKMVTNERQRLYAAATRKQGSVKESGDQQHSPLAAAVDDSMLSSDDRAADSSIIRPDQDNEPEEEQPPTQEVRQEDLSTHLSTPPQLTTKFKQSIVLYVNVVSNTGGALRRVIPRFTLTPEAAPSLSTLLTEVEKKCIAHSASTDGVALGREGRPIVKVWLTDGLVTVVEDGEWMVALLSAGVVDWMDGEVRVLVEV